MKIIKTVVTGLMIIVPAIVGAQNKPEIKIISTPISWGYRASKTERVIDTIIIHTVYNPYSKDKFALKSALKMMKRYRVAPHFIIQRDGTVNQLVDENNVAFHAGWDETRKKARLTKTKREDLDLNSIGIEVINSPKEKPTENQYQALANLVTKLKNKYPIKIVEGHNQAAPGRKTDPWNFDWDYFNKLFLNK